jgi:hypothetical protein
MYSSRMAACLLISAARAESAMVTGDEGRRGDAEGDLWREGTDGEVPR